MRILLTFAAVIVLTSIVPAASVIDFEGVSLNSQGFNNGEPPGLTVGQTDLTPLVSGGATFQNEISKSSFVDGTGQEIEFTFWNGWSWSNVQDSVTPGFGNQYAAFPGGGANVDGSLDPGGSYAMTSSGGFINLPAGSMLLSLQVANATYASTFIESGNAFGPAFGNGDFLNAVITGYDAVGGSGGAGSEIGSTTISLADFSGGQLSQLENWRTLDLELNSFSNATSLQFSFNDSRNGTSTPYYLALDNIRLTAIPEPGSFFAMVVLAGLSGLRRRRLHA